MSPLSTHTYEGPVMPEQRTPEDLPPPCSTCFGTFESVQDAWRASILRLRHEAPWVAGVRDTLSVGSGFGARSRDTREMVATSFTISRPRRRLVSSRVRP